MRSDPPHHTLSARLVSTVLVLCLAVLGCPLPGSALAPTPGETDFQRDAQIPFRLGHVNAIGGNLLVRRVDLSIDTHLGTLELGAVYNSARRAWRWSFEAHYGTAFFVDPSGAELDVSEVPDGEAIPGTRWVVLDARHIKTKAGRVYGFGPTRQLETIHWGQAEYPRIENVFGPSPAGARVVRIRQCTAIGTCSAVFDLAWNERGQLVGVVDRAGRRAEFVWSEAGDQLLEARDALDIEEGRPGFRYEYEGGLLTAITNGEGERSEIEYSNGRVAALRQVGEGDPTDVFFYAQQGDTAAGAPPASGGDGLYVTRHWDALGHEHVYAYDAERRLRDVRNADVDEHVAWTWSGRRQTSRRDADGTSRFFTFAGDDLIREVTPSGNVIDTTYAEDGVDRDDPPHRPIRRIEDSLGLVEEHAYDALGRRIASTNGEGETVSFEYDELGHRIRSVRPWGPSPLLLGFVESGHALTVWASGTTGFGETRAFDAVGNRVEGGPAGEAAPGGVVRRRFDGDRNVRAVELADGGEIEIDVRSDGQITRIARPGGGDHEMRYDGLGRLAVRSERVDGVWHETRFEYDALGRQTAVERPNGMRQEAAFDAAGRPLSIRHLRNGVVEGSRTFVYAGGRLVSSTDSLQGGTEYASYDDAGRLMLFQHADGRFTGYAHDARSRLTGQSYIEPDWTLLRSLHFDYDAADREVAIRDGIASLIEREFDDGRLARIRYGNGLVRTFTWEPGDAPPIASETRAPDGVLVEHSEVTQSLAWPKVVLEATTSTISPEAGATVTSTERYELNGFTGDGTLANRPRIERFVGSAPGSQRAFTFDGRSNLLVEGSTAFAFNAEGNRLLSIDPAGAPSLAYAYDEAGFATLRGDRAITWTAGGRIASYGADHFEWDVAGQPLASTVDGVTTRLLYGGAVGADESGTPVRIDLGEVSIDLTRGAHLYRHLDFRGNVKFTSDAAGSVRAHYEYSPFGLEAVHGSDDDPVRFVMRSEIGELMQLGARIYDPAAGRFLSPDPVFQPINQYAYTLGNPISFHDRDGSEPLLRQLGLGVDSASLSRGFIELGQFVLAVAQLVGSKGMSELSGVLAALGQLLIAIGSFLGSFGWNEPSERFLGDDERRETLRAWWGRSRRTGGDRLRAGALALRRSLPVRASPHPAFA